MLEQHERSSAGTQRSARVGSPLASKEPLPNSIRRFCAWALGSNCSDRSQAPKICTDRH